MSESMTSIDSVIFNFIKDGKNTVDDLLALKKEYNWDIIEISNSLKRLEEVGIIIRDKTKFLISDPKRFLPITNK